jgi:hypothetical protein
MVVYMSGMISRGASMTKVKLTVSLPEDVVGYLRLKSNMSSTIAEAVAEYRDRELERTLERAYRDDAEEAAELAREWEATDVESDADAGEEPTE